MPCRNVLKLFHSHNFFETVRLILFCLSSGHYFFLRNYAFQGKVSWGGESQGFEILLIFQARYEGSSCWVH